MSLINDMLKDLDARRAAGFERSDLPAEVRSLPSAARSAWPRFAAAALAVAALAAGALWWLRVPAPESASPRAVRPAAAPVAAAPATARASLPAPAEAPPQSQAAAAPAPAAQAVSAPRKSNAETPRHPAAARPGIAKPDAERDERGVHAASPGPDPAPAPAPQAGTTVASPVTAAPEPPRIEKRVREPSAHERAEQRFAQAVSLLNRGRSAEAAAALRAALHEQPGHSRARLALAGLLAEQHKLDEARTVLGEGLALDAAQPALAFPMARLLVESGDLAAAERTLAAAAAGAGAEQRAFHAGVLQRLGRHREAIGEYREALRLAPGAGVWWMGLAISLEAGGETAQAREAYERAKASGSLAAELAGFVEAKLRALR